MRGGTWEIARYVTTITGYRQNVKMEIIFAKLSSIPLCDNCNSVVMAICTAITLLIICIYNYIMHRNMANFYVCIVYSMCMNVCMYIYVCVYVFPHCQPAYGGHGSTSLVCLVMWLIAITLGLIVWQGSSMASCPLCLFCKPTIRCIMPTDNAKQEVVLALGRDPLIQFLN